MWCWASLSLVAGLLISPSLVAWMSPTIAGLILAIPISWLTSQRWLGLVFRRAGVLVTPEETTTPPIAKRGKALSKALARAGEDDESTACWRSTPIRSCARCTRPGCRRARRASAAPITADRAVAEAKIADAETIEDAVNWLNRGERLVALSDRALIGMIARLPRSAARQPPPRTARAAE